jgi:phosphate transport system protein
MRTVFHTQLDELTALLGEMCALAGLQMEHATQALLRADLVLAEQVISDHERLVALNRKAEESAVALLVLQAPVARDLRTVVGSLKNAANAERMGGLALHVAKIARRRHPAHALPEEVNGYFAEMGRLAVDLGNNAKDAVLFCDPLRAAQIRHDDDAMVTYTAICIPC